MDWLFCSMLADIFVLRVKNIFLNILSFGFLDCKTGHAAHAAWKALGHQRAENMEQVPGDYCCCCIKAEEIRFTIFIFKTKWKAPVVW